MSISKDDTVLITGASAGIGAIYADRFAKRGHNLVLVARDAKRLEDLAVKLRKEAGVAVEVLPADLSQRSEVGRVEQRLREDRSIGALVNNAGIAAFGKIVDDGPDNIDQVIAINVGAATRLASAAANGFVARARGAIINLASVLALAPERTNPVYGGSKAYIVNFSQALNVEVASQGVQVQVVLPGATRTEIWERGGKDVNTIDPERLMDADELVDAALAGFDKGELVTIPSLPDASDWKAFEAARLNLAPNLSHRHPAARYRLS